MKRFVYAVMLLLGLSLVSPSCAPSPEKAGKRDAKAMCRAIEKDDSKARFKANNSFAKHRVYFQKKTNSMSSMMLIPNTWTSTPQSKLHNVFQ